MEIQGDLFVFGGDSTDKEIYRLSCSSNICTWSILVQKLKIGRSYAVTIPVPDSFCKKNVPDVTIGEFFFKPETLKTLIEIGDTVEVGKSTKRAILV